MFHIIVLLILFIVPVECVNMLEYSEEDIDEFPIDIIPTIYWHPSNPLFACEDPIFKVPYKGYVNFFCVDQPNLYVKSYNDTPEIIYENLYYVDTPEEYNSCNATASHKDWEFLRCDGEAKVPNIFKKTFYLGLGSRTQINHPPEINAGDTIHVIGTGFRTKDNLDSRVGGSCNKTEKDGEYKMRLRLQVCTVEEMNSGECSFNHLTMSSYSRSKIDRRNCSDVFYTQTGSFETVDCIRNYTEWLNNSNLIHQDKSGKCFIQQTREVDDFTGRTNIQLHYVKIPCPHPSCTQWNTTENKNIYMKNQCYHEETRTCTSKINGNFTVEKRYVAKQCPTKHCLLSRVEVEKAYAIQGKCYAPRAKSCVLPWLNLTTVEYEYVNVTCMNYITVDERVEVSTLKSEDDEDSLDMFKTIITCSTIISFLLGIFLRTCSCCMKNSHNKKIDEEHHSRSEIDKSDFVNYDRDNNTRDSSYSDLAYCMNGAVYAGLSSEKRQGEQNRTEMGYVNIARSVSSKQSSPYPLKRNNERENTRLPSTSSRITLLRTVSDASSIHRPLSRSSSAGLGQLHSLCDETMRNCDV